MSPKCQLEQCMTIRIPRQAIQWRKIAENTLWTDVMTPFVLNGPFHVSRLHRPISRRSPPGSNPQLTGWWTISFGIRETKLFVFEWAVHRVYRYCFCMLSAIKSYAAAGREIGRRLHHGWVFGEDLPQPVIMKLRVTFCFR